MGLKPKIDRRPKAYCGNCWRLVGVDLETRVCPYCIKPLSSKRLNVLQLLQDMRRAYDAVNRTWAWSLTFLVFVAGLGWTFLKSQHFMVVDVAYGVVLVAIPFYTWWYVRKRVKPRYPTVYDNPLFRPGIPEAPPEPRRGPGKLL